MTSGRALRATTGSAVSTVLATGGSRSGLGVTTGTGAAAGDRATSRASASNRLNGSSADPAALLPAVVAHAQRTGDVGDWIGVKGSRLWAEGFGLAPVKGIAPRPAKAMAAPNAEKNPRDVSQALPDDRGTTSSAARHDAAPSQFWTCAIARIPAKKHQAQPGWVLRNRLSIAKGLIEMPLPTAGLPFTLEEHAEISRWLERRQPGWPLIELALNYPNTPEMFGIVEMDEIGPSLFMWRTEGAVILAPFSGDDMIRYASIRYALNALTDWCVEATSTGKRPKLRPHGLGAAKAGKSHRDLAKK